MSYRAVFALPLMVLPMLMSPAPEKNAYVTLMESAAALGEVHGAVKPVLSPVDSSVLSGAVPVRELQARGFRVVPWTTNDPAQMKTLIGMGVDGLISDRPDLLQAALNDARAAGMKVARDFDVEGHRGGRGLRPENTLPAFEAGLDNGIDTIETDTGVSTDGVSLIWHDQFYNPQSCRRADGQPYMMANRVYLKDVSKDEAQRMFVCDKLHFGEEQKNDLALSPVAVAFAAQEKMASAYVPTYVEQLFRFVNFYAEYYRAGAGKSTTGAAERARTAAKVRFNLETKILPDRLPAEVAGKQDPNVPAELYQNHTVSPERFVEALCGAIERNGMVERANVQSFDYRTLLLVAEKHPRIPAVYLIDNAKLLGSEFVPAALRQPVAH